MRGAKNFSCSQDHFCIFSIHICTVNGVVYQGSDGRYTMSLLFISRIEIIKRISVTADNQARLGSMETEIMFSVKERNTMTTWASGSRARAISWMKAGSSESGKKVPLKRNMGVINRKLG